MHRDHIDRLDVIFPSKDLVKDIVSGDLVVFNHTSELEFLNAESNIKFLGLIVPSKTLNLKSKNSCG